MNEIKSEKYYKFDLLQSWRRSMVSVIEEGGHMRGMSDRIRELETGEDVLKELLA